MARYGEKQKFVRCITVIRTFRALTSFGFVDVLVKSSGTMA